MVIFKKIDDLVAFMLNKRNEHKKIGFVPTMGALHAGHISLITQSKGLNDLTVVSIFVNPTQFNNAADFDKYPKTIEEDIDKLEGAACDILFLPDLTEIYPDLSEPPVYNIGALETVLEGKFRPGHYQGVCQVVHRLLDIVKPDSLFLGQKDFQQCLVIKKMITDAGLPIDVHVVETLREKDGLAMSSRNVRLTQEQRSIANTIFEVMQWVNNEMKPGDLALVKKQGAVYITKHGFKVDYLEIADPDNLTVMHRWDGKKTYVILAAAFLGDVRLIDNLLIEEKSN